jgi:hypothetical protein
MNQQDQGNYLLESRKNIDKYIHKNEYRKAFFLLVLVLEILDDDKKRELIDYYSENMQLFDLSM